MQSQPVAGSLGRLVHRAWPGAAVQVRQGSEMMIKNFEAAAAGCALIADRTRDIEALGFVPGQTILTYQSFDELVDLLQGVDDSTLEAIGRQAAAFVARHHSWDHRAQEIARALEAILAGRGCP
jgi:spore maturation protein CgeB